ncbi:hypothetical protein GCM10008959_32800 [Deinococcus seoulensis]|uniref:HNH nuclease domain-containing protein n=1 Tax=Deinococcus seoulensis TaxID=1837379 RepID=A0ABQ2RW64_9DEIO|nr:HNH endonuclease [Deinococcus seoulensis]GGR68154.1 hypothetical protein GCM10008959_32800 [Deinococcus seoulensis]
MGKNSKENRRTDAYRKSGGVCWFCGDHPAEHIEHLTPQARGGTNASENLVGACRRCNLLKEGQGIPGNPNWDLREFRQEVAYRLKQTPEQVVFYGERLHAKRSEAWIAAGKPTDKHLYKLGLLDERLGIKAEPFSFPDEPSFEAYGLDDEL